MDTNKGTITRRMDSVLDGLQDAFRVLYCKEDFEYKLQALEEAGTNSDRPSKLRILFDMFDICGIKYERGKDNAYYASIVSNSDIPSFAEIQDRMVLALYNIYDAYPSPEDYMKRIVDRLCKDSDGWNEDTLRIRILKQFIKYGDYLRDAGFGGKKTINDYVKNKIGKKPSEDEILSCLDDDIFINLETATKAQKKANGKFGLLKAADDLASGKFRAEGSTKKTLYLFAMVYGMTYYSGNVNRAEILDPKTDVEINLFRDYYANNLMRYISDAYKEKQHEYERDPSGQGINYKNFAEMIYLYYISTDYSPRDKIRLSSNMIKRVGDYQNKCGKNNSNEEKGTVFYRNLFRNANVINCYSEDILSLEEPVFESFIIENYDCDTFTGRYAISELQLETEQNSAFHEYQAIIQDLVDMGVALENCNYGLWFTDVAAFKKRGYENICDRRPEIDRNKFNEFMELLLAINSFVGYAPVEEISNQNENQEWTDLSINETKALYKNASTITRTSLIVAYYYYFNARHESDGNERWKSFEEVFNIFKMDIDSKLEAANYQPLCGKNIFDVLIVFSAYAYLNI